MNVLAMEEAVKAFVEQATSTEPSSNSLDAFVSANHGVSVVRTGSERFRMLATAIARDAERNLILACNTFGHGLEGTLKGSAPWSGVSFYYAAFYAARVISLTSGASFRRPKLWIDVDRTSTNEIGFKINRSKHPALVTGRGSHKDFWSFYQLLSNKISQDVSDQFSWAVVLDVADADTPHNLRLDLNYDADIALDEILVYQESYDVDMFENWITGKPATLYKYAQAYVGYAVSRAIAIGLKPQIVNAPFADFVAESLDWTRNSAVRKDILDVFAN